MSLKTIIKEVFENAVQQKIIPGAVLTAHDRTGLLFFRVLNPLYDGVSSTDLKYS